MPSNSDIGKQFGLVSLFWKARCRPRAREELPGMRHVHRLPPGDLCRGLYIGNRHAGHAHFVRLASNHKHLTFSSPGIFRRRIAIPKPFGNHLIHPGGPPQSRRSEHKSADEAFQPLTQEAEREDPGDGGLRSRPISQLERGNVLFLDGFRQDGVEENTAARVFAVIPRPISQ